MLTIAILLPPFDEEEKRERKRRVANFISLIDEERLTPVDDRDTTKGQF